MKLLPHTKYKPSNVEWLGQVPEHWEVRKLKYVAEMRSSNVDKHTKEGEQRVRLCNYVDVYKNEAIHPEMDFMHATATADEIQRFRLIGGDVIITKDSEQWDDIGVPALVAGEAPDLICGYHLALLRPFADVVLGTYLFRALQSKSSIHQFSVESKGVTRYALSHFGIKSACIALPPMEEQEAIVGYLDYVGGQISRYVEAKEKLIELLQEQKQAVVQRAVTRGLDSNTPLKDSGVEWLGQVPEHWRITKLRHILRATTERNQTDLPLLSITREKGVILRDLTNKEDNHNYIPDDLTNYKVVYRGQFAMNKMKAWQGSYGISSHNGIVSPAYFIFDLKGIEGSYFHAAIRSNAYIPSFTRASDGVRIGQWDLSQTRMREIKFAIPPIEGQEAIVKYLDKAAADIDKAIDCARREIDLLNEYRTRLTADVVTGKLDVRKAAASLPSSPPSKEPAIPQTSAQN